MSKTHHDNALDDLTEILTQLRSLLWSYNIAGPYEITVPRGTNLMLTGSPAVSTSHDVCIAKIAGFTIFEPVDPITHHLPTPLTSMENRPHG